MENINKHINYIVENYSDMIYRVAFAFTSSSADADDVVSEVIMRYFAILGEKKFKSEEHIKHWLLRVTLNYCKDIAKSASNRVQLSEVESVFSAYFPIEEKLDIEKALEQLPSEYSITIYLYYYEGLKAREIAKLMKVSTSTVAVRLKEAKAMLRCTLKEYRTTGTNSSDLLPKER